MAASNTRSSRAIAEYNHIVDVILDEPDITACLNQLKLTKRKVKLVQLCEDPLKRDVLKYKDDKNVEQDLSDDSKYLLQRLPSYLDYEQNCLGTINHHPIDITTLDRDKFEIFMGAIRSVVTYDPAVAYISEQRNFPSANTTTTSGNSNNNNTGSNNTGGNTTNTPSAATKKMDALVKSVGAPDAKKCPILKDRNGFPRFVNLLTTHLEATDCDEVLNPNYVIPPGEEALDKKKCLLVFSIFQTNVQSVEGKDIVENHRSTRCGRKCYADLLKEHQNIYSKHRFRRAKKFLNNVQIPKVLQKPLIEYLTEHNHWVNQYNDSCDPSRRMGVEERLDSLENYMERMPGYEAIQAQMDLFDAQTGNKMTSQDRIHYYFDYARNQEKNNDQTLAPLRRRGNYTDISTNSALICGGDNGYEYDPSDFNDIPISAHLGEVVYEVSMTEYTANAVDARNGKVRFGYIHPDDYNALSPDSKKKFLSIPAKEREIIVSSRGARASGEIKSPDHLGNKVGPPKKPGLTSRTAHVSAAENEVAENLVPADTEDAVPTVDVVCAETEEANVEVASNMLRRSLAQGPVDVNAAAATLPPAIAAEILEEKKKIKKLVNRASPLDPRRVMSDQNTIVVPRRPYVSPPNPLAESSTTPAGPTTTTVPRSAFNVGVEFPDLLGGPTVDVSANEVIPFSATSDDASASGSDGFAELDASHVIEYHVHASVIEYHIAHAHQRYISHLIDGGSSGGLLTDEGRWINFHPTNRINVKGVGDHKIKGLRVGTCLLKLKTVEGHVIGVFHQYGKLDSGKPIHSCLQLRDGGCDVSDIPKSQGGEQMIRTKEGFVIPLDVENGLCYMKGEYPTDEDLADPNIPYVIMTRDRTWDPANFSSNQTDDDDALADLAAAHPRENVHPNFNDFGEYLQSTLSDIFAVEKEDGEVIGAVAHGEHTYRAFRVATTGELLDEPDLIYRPWDVGRPPTTYVTELYANVGHFADFNTIDDYYGEQSLAPIEYEELRMFFLGVPSSTVRHTFDSTTRYYRNLVNGSHFMTYRSPYPANNVFRRHEPVITDTAFSDTPAWGGITAAQVYVGKFSRYISVHGVKTDGEFVKTLEDEIRKRGAMDKLVSDRAAAEVSAKVKDILRTLFIDDWQSEPYYHHQLFVERIIQEIKKFSNRVLNWSGAPKEAWFFVFEYVSFIMNRTAKEGLDWRTPVEALSGYTPDISCLLHFSFWEPVYIKNYQGSGKHFPSESDEILVRFVGYSEGVGHSMTFKVWNEETGQLLYRSCLRKVDRNLDKNAPPYDPDDTNKDIDSADDEDIPQVVQVRAGDGVVRSPTIMPDELIGRHFLMDTREDGQRFRAKIVGYEVTGDNGIADKMDEFESELAKHPERVRFKVEVGDAGLEEYVGWNDMCEFIEEQAQNEDQTWNFRKIVGHKKNLKSREEPQVLIQWESGEITFEPIREIYRNDPYLLAEYAAAHGLIDEWQKRYKSLKLRKHAKNAKKLMRMNNQAKLRAYREGPIYMYGEKVPRNHVEAMRYDEENGNTKWRDAEELEKSQLFEYNCFEDRGHKDRGATVPEGYKKIRVHMVYAVKHDGRFKARCVADGHLCDPPLESVYSGVVSLRGIRMVLFLAELNGLEVYQTDVGNAYLEAKTKERVYIIAPAEFGDLKDHVLIIIASLYGLPSSGKRWYERLHDVLRGMGFRPCPAEPEIWMRACKPDGTVMSWEELEAEEPQHVYDGVSRPVFDGFYEYIATYCDDLTVASLKPSLIISHLTDVEKFKLKGTGPIHFLLGCDYFRDKDGTLCSEPKKYIEKMESTYERLFKERPKYRNQPLDTNDHPELDTTDFLDFEKTKIYQSLVGAAQWVISLGRFDLSCHIMTLSSFRAAPRVGHLERMKRVYGYLSKLKHGTIRYRTGMPDFSGLNFVEQDWSRTVYAGTREEYPSNLPRARGKPVQQSTYVDANLYHDMLSGKAITAVLHYLNQTPIDWYSRKQSTVETATFGSESTAARTAIEQIRTLKLTLLYLGVPIIDRAILVGDNKTVVESTTLPHSKLHKRHLMLSYHFVREAIASGNYAFCWLDGKLNPADILSKHWGYQVVWSNLLQPILFWQGDTGKLLDKDES